MTPRGFSRLVRPIVRIADLSDRACRIAMVSALAALVFGTLLAVPPGPAAAAATTWYVAPSGSDSNSCMSLSSPCEHIQTAIDRAASGDEISIAAGTYTETLSISTNLTLTGAGAGSTIIDGDNHGTVLSLTPVGSVTLSDATIQHSPPYYPGGGIYNQGGLTLIDSTVSSNVVSDRGGGIYNKGAVALIDSTVTDNRATYGGGGIYNEGTLTVIDSTVSDNSAVFGEDGGGGIDNVGTATLTNSTVSALPTS